MGARHAILSTARDVARETTFAILHLSKKCTVKSQSVQSPHRHLQINATIGTDASPCDHHRLSSTQLERIGNRPDLRKHNNTAIGHGSSSKASRQTGSTGWKMQPVPPMMIATIGKRVVALRRNGVCLTSRNPVERHCKLGSGSLLKVHF